VAGRTIIQARHWERPVSALLPLAQMPTPEGERLDGGSQIAKPRRDSGTYGNSRAPPPQPSAILKRTFRTGPHNPRRPSWTAFALPDKPLDGPRMTSRNEPTSHRERFTQSKRGVPVARPRSDTSWMPSAFLGNCDTNTSSACAAYAPPNLHFVKSRAP